MITDIFTDMFIFLFAASSVVAIIIIFHEWSKKPEEMGMQKLRTVVRAQGYVNSMGWIFTVLMAISTLFDLLHIVLPVNKLGAYARVVNSFSSAPIFGRAVIFFWGISLILNARQLKKQFLKTVNERNSKNLQYTVDISTNISDGKTSLLDKNLGFKGFLIALAFFAIFIIISLISAAQ